MPLLFTSSNNIFLFYFFFLVIFTIPFAAQSQTDSIYEQVDIPPLFEGCNDELISSQQQQDCSLYKIMDFVQKNIVYPDSAKAKQIEGVVLVKFLVGEDGRVLQAELLRDIGYDCGREALRIIRAFPAFIPAQKDKKNVATYMTMPIRFRAISDSLSNAEAMFQLHWGTLYQDTLSKTTLLNLLNEPISVRDYYGNTYIVRDVEITYIYKNKAKTEKIYSANLSEKQKKLLRKAKLQGVVTILATVERPTFERVEVYRELDIVSP